MLRALVQNVDVKVGNIMSVEYINFCQNSHTEDAADM